VLDLTLRMFRLNATLPADHPRARLAKKRTKLRRDMPEIVNSVKHWLDVLDSSPPTTHAQLRERVKNFVPLSHDVKELALFHVQPMLPFDSGAERILAYLKLFVGQEIEGEELEVVSGISEYARRVREWRVEFGWPIVHKGSRYVLERDQPDAEKAKLWSILNSVRRGEGGARDKMLALFRSLPIGKPVSTAQLRYVAHGKDMRRVRELRTEFGWRIMTRNTGMPQLRADQYVLVDPEPMEAHDRHVDTETLIAVLERDKNTCQKCGWHPGDRTPGDPRQYIELHHIAWHSKGGANERKNLATLCNVHHRAVHTLRLEPEAFGNWVKKRD